jgi:hypothetical protein
MRSIWSRDTEIDDSRGTASTQLTIGHWEEL